MLECGRFMSAEQIFSLANAVALVGWLILAIAGRARWASSVATGVIVPLLLAGWIHYLCFDLFIGSWEVRDAKAQGISHWLVIPCLFLTFMFGPVGLLLYFALRAVRTRTIAISP